MKPDISSQKGFTLIELMVAMAIAGIVAAAMFTFQQTQTRGYVTQEVLANMQQNARAAMHFMVSEIRMAGCDPTGSANAGIARATDDSITFTMDIAGPDILSIDFDDSGQTDYQMQKADGNIDSTEEMITYTLNDSNIVRADHHPDFDDTLDPDDSKFQTMGMNFDALNFLYYNKDGDHIPNPGNNINAIRSVVITVVARSGESVPGFMYRHSDTSTYRNQEGHELFNANDNFRRIMLSTEVRVRNAGLG